MKKSVFSLIILFMLTSVLQMSHLYAQSGTNSPYSMYGYGVLGDQSTGFSRGMNGIGIGMREKGHVNYLNPASYSNIDSLTFIFDVAMTMQNSNFKETTFAGTKSINAKNADFEYAVGQFRLVRHVGMSFGIVPYSNVGYNYTTSSKVVNNYIQYPSTKANTTVTTTNVGEGGLHQIFLGAGWEITKRFSIGANVNYLWGDIEHVLTSSYSDNYVKTLLRYYEVSVTTIKLDLGLNYTLPLNKNDEMTFGLTYTPDFKMGSTPTCEVITMNSQSAVYDTTMYRANDAMKIPMQLGFGVTWKHNDKWLVGMDYTYQKWSSLSSKDYIADGTGASIGDTDDFKDRHKINFGGQYCKNASGRSFGDRIRYRFGIGYTTPYIYINDKKGPREISMSAGVGIPIINTYNNRSTLNVSLQWTNSNATGMIRDNTFRINLGLTFNERWFAKWKFE